MKRLRKLTGLLLIVALLTAFAAVSLPASAEGTGTTYYLDAVSGSDENAGTSATAAWKTLSKVNATTFQPGDSILLKKGCSWNGYLWPKGSGTKDAPITLSSYGDSEEMPVINGNGVHFEQGGDFLDATVYFRNQEHWIVENLEVTNFNGSLSDKNTVVDCAGIHFDATTQRGTLYGVTIRNNKVHNISNQGNAGDHGRQGAINVWARSWYKSFADVLVEDNTVYDVGATGINVNAECPADTVNGGKNIVVQNNYLYNIGGDGILMNECVGPLVQYNVVNNSHIYSTAACVALWPFASTDSVFQFNEAYNTKTAYDGQGFDADYMCKGTLFQYNYGHDNEGGFMLICCEPTNWDGSKIGFNEDVVVRYNIGQNNSRDLFMLSGQIKNTKIYNNTLYTKWGLGTGIVGTYSRDGKTYPDNTQFINNIFYVDGGGSFNWGGSTNTVWENNLMYGKSSGGAPESDTTIFADPLFVDAGGAGVGMDTCVAYKLSTKSPAIGAGQVVADNGGRDFFGNPVSQTEAPNIGAYQGPGVEVDETVPNIEESYAELYNWEDAEIGKKNMAIPFVNSNTSTWMGSVAVTDAAAALSTGYGSTKALQVNYTASYKGNFMVELYLRPDTLKHAIAVRFWLKTELASQSMRISFVGPNGMNYYKQISIPAGGGWVEIPLEGKLNIESTGKPTDVTLAEMRGTTNIRLRFDGMAAGDISYLDDVQLKLDPDFIAGQGGDQPPQPSFTNPFPVNADGQLHGLTLGQNSVADVVSAFTVANGAQVKIYNGSTEMTTGAVGTGMEIVISAGDADLQRYTVLVYGDTNGDGKVTAGDLLQIKRHVLTLSPLTGVQLKAADVTGTDGSVISSDVVNVKRAILGMATLNQNR